MNLDREILVGVLAYELGFVARDVLVGAVKNWSVERNKSLSALLVERGALTAQRQTLVEALVDEQCQLHDGDPTRAMAALSSKPPVAAELERIVRPQLHATLADLSLTLPTAIGENDTPPLLLGVSSSAAGRFRILRPHAKGGLGEVFVAHDGELKREVAVKQIQPHADAADNRARFVLEAEITGGLEHPGVVPVYGLGTDAQGRPFYAMRFIKGESFKEAIKRFHGSRLPGTGYRERGNPQSIASVEFRKLLGRFIDVCNAIEYAHSRGIMHRDLKPENVMLGGFGETLVVDWGLARTLGPIQDHRMPADEADCAGPSDPSPAMPAPGQVSSATSPTVMGSAVGTPAYMSPEQAEGRLDCVGRASDVYSLGATLYYLLTGRPAFDEPGVLRLLERVKRGEFPRPRETNRVVPPALEAIVLRAMARDPAKRYPSARALADDLERWLADEPVSAHRGAWSERLARRARRHRRGVQAAAAAMVVITIVSVVAAVMIRSAKRDLEREHARVKTALTAETEAKAEARKAIDNYVNLVTEEHVLRDEGVQPLRKRLLQDARRYYDDLIKKHGHDGKLGHELAGAILRVGRINNETGSKDEAIKAFRQALELFEKLAEENPEAENYQSDMALCLRSLGVLEGELLRHEPSLENFKRAMEIEQELVDAHPHDARHRRDLAVCFFHVGDAEQNLRREKQAFTHFQRALEIQRDHVQRDPTRPEYQSDLSATELAIGRLHIKFDRPSMALAPLEESLRIRTSLVENHPTVAKYQSDQAAGFNSLAICHMACGKRPEALGNWRKALAIRSKLADDNPAVTSYQFDLAAAYSNVGYLYDEERDYASALENHRRAVFLRQKLVDENPSVTQNERDLSDSYYNVGRVQEQLGRWDEALANFQRALGVKQKMFDDNPNDAYFRSALGAAWDNVGRALARLGRFEDAMDAYQEAIECQRAALTDFPKEPRFHELLAIHAGGVVVARLGLEQPAEAAEAEVERRKLSHDQPEALYEFAAGLAGLVDWIGRERRTVSAGEQQQRRQCVERAIEALREVLTAGFKDRDKLRDDPALAPLGDEAEFQELMKGP